MARIRFPSLGIWPRRASDPELGEILRVLDRMGAELDGRDTPPASGLRVLYGPSFSVFGPCLIHDRLLSYALRLRGAEILPVYCDAMQCNECNVSGGVWQGGTFAEACAFCTRRAEMLWKGNPAPPLALSRYLDAEDQRHADEFTRNLGPDEWPLSVDHGMPLGLWARDILVNNYVVGDYHRIVDFEVLGPSHVRNLLLLRAAYERILDTVRPDCVVANDSYYGMWAVLQTLCERRGIPFYSHWLGGRRDGWCYAYNDAAMNLDFRVSWPAFSAAPLGAAERRRVEDWLDGRIQGESMILDTASLAVHQRDEPGLSSLVPEKPTALLPANIIWDLAALNKQIVFSDMMEWIRQTILWFADHPQYQLIVKAHPGELNPKIPATEERVDVALSDLIECLPPNVAFVSPTANVTVYDLLPMASVGLMHTSTVGFEMAAQGKPVITTARSPYRGFGFTIDAENPSDYFDKLHSALEGEFDAEADRLTDLAFKYISFYMFHYYSKIDFMDYRWGEHPKLKVRALDELMPGRNAPLDYVVESIIQGLPILGPNRWPPES